MSKTAETALNGVLNGISTFEMAFKTPKRRIAVPHAETPMQFAHSTFAARPAHNLGVNEIDIQICQEALRNRENLFFHGIDRFPWKINEKLWVFTILLGF